MLKTHIYIVQIVGIIAILCGYFLSDQPDSLSQMHFDSDRSCALVFSKATKNLGNGASDQIFSSSQNNPTRKSNVPKFISYEVIMPGKEVCRYHPLTNVVYDFPLTDEYTYLFYEEINPPPPKAC